MAEGVMTPRADLRSQQPARHGAPSLQAEPAHLDGQAAAVSMAPNLESRAEGALARATEWLLAAQRPEGYWWAELEADVTLESDIILLLQILSQTEGRSGNIHLFSPKVAKLARYIRDRQTRDGGWNIYPGGPPELNATVKAYIALRIAGDAADAPHLLRARDKIRELGGIEATNSYVRFYLAMVGAIDWNLVPAIPPELMLPPNWFPLNIYEMSSWTRAIVIPLAVIYAHKPGWRLPEGVTADELFAKPGATSGNFRWDRRLFSWRNAFLLLDLGLKLHEKSPWKPFRRIALRRARKWIYGRLEGSEGLATILPAMMNSICAMLAEGKSRHDPLVTREIAYLERYEIEENDAIRLQPCISPVWDTAIAMVSLQEARLDPRHPGLAGAANWLLGKQILAPGDWEVRNKSAAPGGWAFEFRNDAYPDVDDTAFVLMALGRSALPNSANQRAAIRRGLSWMVSMQNRDGGWGAFDHENNLQFLNHIPFADHNAMLDPSTADVTARALECLGQMGWPASHPVMQRALGFLQKDQAREGAWFGRWGVNYVYGTSGVLRAAEKIETAGSPEVRRGADWLRLVQNPDGGFGESVESYYDPSLKGHGRSTASQTAWGLIGLLAAVGPADPSVERAVNWLVAHQGEDGSWPEDDFTGTGFPCVFYLKYHLYRVSFPLYALARYANMLQGREIRSMQVRAEEIEHPNGYWG